MNSKLFLNSKRAKAVIVNYLTMLILFSYFIESTTPQVRNSYQSRRYNDRQDRQPYPASSSSSYQPQQTLSEDRSYGSAFNRDQVANGRYQPGQMSQRELIPRRNMPRINSDDDDDASVIDKAWHRCRFMVPAETVDKYPWANTVGPPQGNELQMIEACCKGFGPIRWRGVTYCRPLCESCQNGLCVAPNVCQCYDEFVLSDNGECVFTCPLGCLNGQCYLDGTCICEPGYKLDESRKFCRPICSGGCGLNKWHNCTEPEVCGCAKGYRLADNGCQPVCDPECGLGGECMEANVCECKAGYTEKGGVCQSDCYQKCDNGICYSRNRCICNPGYTYHERSTQCIPI